MEEKKNVDDFFINFRDNRCKINNMQVCVGKCVQKGVDYYIIGLLFLEDYVMII